MTVPSGSVRSADISMMVTIAVDYKTPQYLARCPMRMAWSKVVRFFETVASVHKWGLILVSRLLQAHRAGTWLSCEHHLDKLPQVLALRNAGKDVHRLP